MLFFGFWSFRIFLLWLYYILHFFYSCTLWLHVLCVSQILMSWECVLNFWVFSHFCWSNMFLILSLFLSYSGFFIISVNSFGLFLLYVETYAKNSSLLCFFGGVAVLLMVLVKYPVWWSIMHNSTRQFFLRFLLVTMVYILCAWM